jgi:hypothetical protein
MRVQSNGFVSCGLFPPVSEGRPLTFLFALSSDTVFPAFLRTERPFA